VPVNASGGSGLGEINVLPARQPSGQIEQFVRSEFKASPTAYWSEQWQRQHVVDEAHRTMSTTGMIRLRQ
jgi:hypothetical protein